MPPTGFVPFRIDSALGRLLLVRLVLRGLFHRVLTVRSPLGRRMRSKILGRAMPLLRTRPGDLEAAGVKRVPRVVGVRDGLPLLEDGRTLAPANVIWCTGYHPGFSWIDLPGLDGGAPRHEAGVAVEAPGLYFVGLNFLYSMSSGMVHGVARDAERIARAVGAALATEPVGVGEVKQPVGL